MCAGSCGARSDSVRVVIDIVWAIPSVGGSLKGAQSIGAEGSCGAGAHLFLGRPLARDVRTFVQAVAPPGLRLTLAALLGVRVRLERGHRDGLAVLVHG